MPMNNIGKKLKNKFNNFVYKTAQYPATSTAKNYELDKIGNSYSFCMVPKGYLDSTSIVYSFGAGEDITSDISLIEKYNCEVKVFDPTPKSIAHFENLKQSIRQGTDFFNDQGHKYEMSTPSVIDKIQFEEIALWKEDTRLKFYMPKDKDHVSCSINNIQNTNDYVEVEAMKLSTMMNNLGHEQIDYLKLDIEGAEFAVIENILQENLAIKIIYLEYHYLDIDKALSSTRAIKNSLKTLMSHGYVIIDNDRNRYFTLIKS